MKKQRYIVVKNPLDGYHFSLSRCHAAFQRICPSFQAIQRGCPPR